MIRQVTEPLGLATTADRAAGNPFSVEAQALGKSGVTVHNINVGFDPSEASTQLAQKILPELQKSYAQQMREYQGAVRRSNIARQIGGLG